MTETNSRTDFREDIREKTGLTGSMLKLLAVVFMVLDHSSAILIQQRMLKGGMLYSPFRLLSGISWEQWFFTAKFLRCVGRLAFPIFMFFLVEGFVYTRNKKAYAVRLFFFALVSEIPFDFAFYGKCYYPGYQNVMFTMFIAFLTLWAMQRYAHIPWLQFFFPWLGYLTASLLHVDYGGMGVLMAVVLYVYQGSKKQLEVGAVMAALDSLRYYGTAALSFLLLWFYRGARGKWPGKYFFYLVYPGHLLVLAWIARKI